MSLYKPSELRQFLDTHFKKASKSLSQNFLIDKNILDKIILANKNYKSFPVLEIGPGPGALTEQLLASGFKVNAVELDKEFASILEKRLTPFYPQLSVIQDDFLQLDLQSALFKEMPVWTVIANLPYHISTKALVKLLIHSKYFASITLMVQKEFYDRICQTSGKDYGILNVMCKVLTSRMESFKVSSSCFYPAPNVDSCVMTLTINSNFSPELLKSFYDFLKLAFSSRRKKLLSSLKDDYSLEKLDRAFLDIGIDFSARCEDVSYSQFFQLFSSLNA